MQNKLTEQELWLYNRLDELQRRMYLGEKAIALGRSGCRIIAERYDVNIKTVRQGKKEFLNPDFDAPVHILDSLYQEYYPDADTIVILCDGGGSNSCRHRIFKQRLIELARMIHMNIKVVHYPPYCSKYNPIEHRLF